jgi:ribosomal protein S18 acetylase RimI-like enzyme
MEILKATKQDAEIICKNNIRMAKETENINLSSETALQGVLALIDHPSKGFYLLARIDEKIVGQLMITYEWSDWRNNTIWWIQSVYVIPSYRRKGVFQSLFSFVMNMAKEQNIPSLRLYVYHENTSAIKVYEKLGMKQTAYVMFETNQI